MFKNKMYVYGLGVGLIIGAIMLQLMLIPTLQRKETTPEEELDPAQLKQEASQYFQLFDKDVKVYTQPEFDDQMKKRVQLEQEKLAAAAPSPNPVKQIVVYVQPELSAMKVSELLYRSGLINDRVAFEAEMRKQKATDKIQVGAHVFEGNPDMQEIIKILQTKP